MSAAIIESPAGPITLCPDRAAFLPARRTLLVADIHLGKARTFRRFGLPVPGGTTQDTLDRLGAAIDATGAERVVVLGDLLHSRHAQDSPAMAALAQWRAARASLALVLVRGNHDDHAGDPPAALGIDVVDEPFASDGLWLCHDATDPAVAAAAATAPDGGIALRVGGHVHPGLRLHGRAHDSVRVPCFHLGDGFLVLPAFGAFTGLHLVRPSPGERVWAVVEDRVVALP